MKAEVREVLAAQGVTKMSMRPVRRAYAFENRHVPHGEQWVLKVKYPGTAPALAAGLTGMLTCLTSLSLSLLASPLC